MRDLDDPFVRSAFRRRFPLGEAERRYLWEKGLESVLEHDASFIERRLAPNDGKQTPSRSS
jgi:hypothetical protein